MRTMLCACFFLGVVTIAYGNSSASKQLTNYPNQLTRDGELVILPNHGTVYIATDFHAHWSDFNQWLKRTRLIERLEVGEDVYGLILGDVVDHKPGDPVFELSGDAEIVDRIMEVQRQLGEKGKRLIYLKGNHESAAVETYAKLRKHGMVPGNRQRMIDSLYRSPLGSYYQQFNFIERMTNKHYDYLIRLPTVAVGKRGLVAVHAGVSSVTTRLAHLVDPSPKALYDLLWGRPDIVVAGGYTPSQTQTFLKKIGGSLLIVGHTPLNYLPRKNVKDGVARLGECQLFFSTGYGAPPGTRSYLSIDLSKRYESVCELEYEVEIHPLYPQRAK